MNCSAAQERPALLIIWTPGRLFGLKKRGSIVAWRHAGDGPSVVVFLMRSFCSHTGVYCKLFPPVSWNAPMSKVLLCWGSQRSEKRERYTAHPICLSTWIQTSFFLFCFWPEPWCYKLPSCICDFGRAPFCPPLTIWLMVQGWDECLWLTVEQLIPRSAAFLCRQNESEPPASPPPPQPPPPLSNCQKTAEHNDPGSVNKRNNPLIKSFLAGKWERKLFQQCSFNSPAR